jgi:homoserine kinase
MARNIKVFSPATVANVGCGFDVLGFALESPGDIVEVRLKETTGITIIDNTGLGLPTDPTKNTSGASLQAMLDKLGSTQGFELIFHEKINPGSGIGSSSASAAASIFAVNELMGKRFSKKELVEFGMQGEKAGCGVAHADNVAPALMGGFVIVRSYNPLDVISVPCPDNLYCTVVHPDIVVRTEDSRNILPKDVPLAKAVRQWGNVASLIAGLYESDYDLIGRSLEDFIVTPVRSKLIPGFDEVRNAAMAVGALGCNISGSGPSMFALSKDEETANSIAEVMQAEFAKLGTKSNVYVSKVNKEGPRVI